MFRSLLHWGWLLPVLGVLGGWMVLPAGASAVEGTWRVRPDSREYCGELANRLATLPAATREPAHSLGLEGIRLCESGHIRTGVTKLRRAIHEAQVD
ncbi:hypothetical protein [Roseomonas elaeocarpi]|uniref:Uncharacterized protein n=1 Tax=Roseomonas elaeocarpi TaxID=907779 RepID=A0ABV6JQ60_9PROT